MPSSLLHAERSVLRTHRVLLAVFVFLLVAFTPVRTAQAQWGDIDPMSMLRSPIQSTDVELLTRFLSLDEDQQMVIRSLQKDYETQWTESTTSYVDSAREISEEMGFEDGEMPAVDMENAERMQEMARDLQKKTRERREALLKLRDSFYTDVKMLLTEEQKLAWPRYERERRRRMTMKVGAQFSGENVDLIEILESLKLSESEAARIAPLSNAYATELDASLKTRNETGGMLQDLQMKMMNFDPMGGGNQEEMMRITEKLMSGMEDMVKLRRTIAETNRRHGPLLAGQLAGDNRAEFDRLFHRACFPRVYAETEAHRYLQKIRDFEDLSEGQTNAIDTLARQFETSITGLNRDLADIQLRIERNMIEQLDNDMNPMIRMMLGGMSMYDETLAYESPVLASDMLADKEIEERRVRVYDEKRALVRSTIEKLHALLTPSQQEEAPAPEVSETDSSESIRRETRRMFNEAIENMSRQIEAAQEQARLMAEQLKAEQDARDAAEQDPPTGEDDDR